MWFQLGSESKAGVTDDMYQPSEGAGLLSLGVLFPDFPVLLLLHCRVSYPWNPSQSSKDVGTLRGLAADQPPSLLSHASLTLTTTCFLQTRCSLCPALRSLPPSVQPRPAGALLDLALPSAQRCSPCPRSPVHFLPSRPVVSNDLERMRPQGPVSVTSVSLETGRGTR